MNTRTLIAAILATTSTAFFAPLAMAQEATLDTTPVSISTLSRDAVRADAIAALKAGLIERGEASLSVTKFVATADRAVVAAEAREALRLGVLAFGEGPAPQVTPAQAESIRMAGLTALSQNVAQAVR